MTNRYFSLWALVLPISSILVLPQLPGTTPAFLLAISAIPLALLFAPRKRGFIVKWLLIIISIVVILGGMSQLGLLRYPSLDVTDLRLVNAYSGSLAFPSSFFTQSLYLLVGLVTLVFVTTLYIPQWDQYIFVGALLLALYGLYEFTFFLLTGSNGDFLSNRMFSTGDRESLGSLFQTFTIGGLSVMRLKSLTGEPSMYAFTILPFWIYAIHRQKYFLQWLLFLTLILTTTTTALVGITIYIGLRIFYSHAFRRFLQGRLDVFLGLILAIGLGVLIFAFPIVQGFYQEMVINKLTAGNLSGVQRSSWLIQSLRFFADAPLPIQLTGIGFGYIRSTDFFSTLLVNTGVLGTLLFSGLFLYPIFKLNNSYRSLGLKSSLVVIFVMLMIAVPEFSYLSTWLFLGIAYHEVRRQQRAVK